MQCSEVRKFVYVYLDGEFEPRECADFERHVADCAGCREEVELERSFHGLLRERLDRPTAPPALRARILADIDQEESRDAGLATRIRQLPAAWKALPALAAAALVLVMLWPRGPVGLAPSPTAAIAEQDGSVEEEPLDGLVAEAVAVHEVGLPDEVSGDGEAIGRFVERNVSFQAAAPWPDSPTTRLMGARRVRVGTRPAVAFSYRHHGRRVTVVQFPDRLVRSRAPFRRATFTGVGKTSPYSVTVVRDAERRLYHSVVGDVEDTDLPDLVPASFTRPR